MVDGLVQRGGARFVAIKVPVNFDTAALQRDCRAARLVLLEKFKKMHLLVLQANDASKKSSPRGTTNKA